MLEISLLRLNAFTILMKITIKIIFFSKIFPALYIYILFFLLEFIILHCEMRTFLQFAYACIKVVFMLLVRCKIYYTNVIYLFNKTEKSYYIMNF